MVQGEDEERQQNGEKKRLRGLTTAKHIRRTSFSALKVDTAVAVLNISIADALRLRRHGGWQ